MALRLQPTLAVGLRPALRPGQGPVRAFVPLRAVRRLAAPRLPRASGRLVSTFVLAQSGDVVPRPGREPLPRDGGGLGRPPPPPPPPRPRVVLRRSTAGSAEPETPASSPAEPPTLLSRLRALALLAWSRIIRPLRDFGFGRRNIWEGGVGLFVVGGFGALCAGPTRVAPPALRSRPARQQPRRPQPRRSRARPGAQ